MDYTLGKIVKTSLALIILETLLPKGYILIIKSYPSLRRLKKLNRKLIGVD